MVAFQPLPEISRKKRKPMPPEAAECVRRFLLLYRQRALKAQVTAEEMKKLAGDSPHFSDQRTYWKAVVQGIDWMLGFVDAAQAFPLPPLPWEPPAENN